MWWARSLNVCEEVPSKLFYILWTGCRCKALPKDLPPKGMVHDYLGLSNGSRSKRIMGTSPPCVPLAPWHVGAS